eukprot:TRINITY_DN3976_c0_g1_i1.p1 TRINITY_DN3976_c0_g1~~TRINITY_DN3976_c0_g1_i1.p1  ORF type:complete len:116 (+),score=32.57 TRINITY_DN3976_c0_g1_i1:19-366(+)
MSMATLSDRERHNLLLKEKREREAREREQAPQPDEKKGAIATKVVQVQQVISPSPPSSSTTKRVWACSNCVGCEEFVKGGAGKCKSCKCDLLYHLKEEEDYGDRCLGMKGRIRIE